MEAWIYRVEWAWEWGMERGGKEYTEWETWSVEAHGVVQIDQSIEGLGDQNKSMDPEGKTGLF